MKKVIFLCCISALLATGCATMNPQAPVLTAKQCFDLGVDPFRNSGAMGVVEKQVVGTYGTVDKGCFRDNGLESPGVSSAVAAGCAIEDEGKVTIYASDESSRLHEWCHAIYGGKHAQHSDLVYALLTGRADPADYPQDRYPLANPAMLLAYAEKHPEWLAEDVRALADASAR